jgi:bisphosphoglycerate-independent phosphoglycerate mutase (AlkP superfamily)
MIAGPSVVGRALDDGVLADVAPTILELAGLPGWPGITGRSLLRD